MQTRLSPQPSTTPAANSAPSTSRNPVARQGPALGHPALSSRNARSSASSSSGGSTPPLQTVREEGAEHHVFPPGRFAAVPIRHAEPAHGVIQPENYFREATYTPAFEERSAATHGPQDHFADLDQGGRLPAADCFVHAFDAQHAEFISTLDPATGASANERATSGLAELNDHPLRLDRANLMTAEALRSARIPDQAQAILFIADSGSWHYARIERDERQRFRLRPNALPALTHVDMSWHQDLGMGGTARVASLTADGLVPEAQRGLGVPMPTDTEGFAQYCTRVHGSGWFAFTRHDPPPPPPAGG